MQYQKVISLLDNTPEQPSKFGTKNWVEIKNDAHGTYNKNNQIKFKILMAKSSLYDYGDAYKLDESGADNVERIDERKKGVIFKKCFSFTGCISKTSNSLIDNARDSDAVIPKHNLIEYSYNYSKTSGSLWLYYRDKPNDNIVDSESLKFKIYKTLKTHAAANTKYIKIA